MWLSIPENNKEALWEGALESDPAIASGVQRGSGDRMDKDTADRLLRNLPIVSIGQPETWSLSQVYPLEKMPPILRAKVEDAHFYLVRLSCSFRSRSGGTQVEWARFQVSLHPDSADRTPTAFDMYPLQVINEVKRNTRVTLAPTVKFQEVEASIGSLEFGFEYTEIQPVISATGTGESTPSWDYQAAKGGYLQGSKWMHLLVKAPLDMASGFATLDLTADVFGEGFRLPVFAKPKVTSSDPLTVRLWPD